MEQAKGHGKPSHNSWQELSLLILTEPSSVPESGKLFPFSIHCTAIARGLETICRLVSISVNYTWSDGMIY